MVALGVSALPRIVAPLRFLQLADLLPLAVNLIDAVVFVGGELDLDAGQLLLVCH